MNFINRLARRRRINRAVRELSALSNDTLKDIGVERGNIASMVEHMMDTEIDQPNRVTNESRHPFHATSGATA